MLNVQSFWQFIVVGAVVILAVLIDQPRGLLVGSRAFQEVNASRSPSSAQFIGTRD